MPLKTCMADTEKPNWQGTPASFTGPLRAATITEDEREIMSDIHM